MSDEKNKDSKPADTKSAPSELEKLKAELAAAHAELVKQKDEHIADLKAALASRGASVLVDAKQAQEEARVAKHVEKLHAMRARAIEIAGPKAKTVKYIVGPSGTVRPGLGVVKQGKIISVPITELPAGEWTVYDPAEFEPDAQPREAKGASEFKSGNAEKAIAQREALKQLREG